MLNKLKNQLTLWYSLGILTAIILLLVFFFYATSVVFYRQVDETLKTHVNSLVASLEKDKQISGCGCLSPNSTLLLGVLAMPGMPTAIFNENGQVVKSSVDFITPSNPPSSSNPLFFNAPLSGQSYRFLRIPVKNNNQIIGSVLMGHPIETFLQTRRILIIFIMIIMFITIIPAVLLARFLAEKALFREKQFLTDLTHSLKTPLAVLQSEVENSKLAKSALLSQISKLSSLVNEALESNYLQSDQKNAFTDLTGLLKELCEITQALGLEKKITLTQNLPSAALWVKGHKQQLAKTLLSVLENAVHYEKIHGRITVSLTTNKKKAIVTIADDGKGIDQEDLPHVFDRFYRGKNLKNTGHGLGLAIAKNIIEELGGRISLESKPGKGTTVNITLLIVSSS